MTTKLPLRWIVGDRCKEHSAVTDEDGRALRAEETAGGAGRGFSRRGGTVLLTCGEYQVRQTE